MHFFENSSAHVMAVFDRTTDDRTEIACPQFTKKYTQEHKCYILFIY